MAKPMSTIQSVFTAADKKTLLKDKGELKKSTLSLFPVLGKGHGSFLVKAGKNIGQGNLYHFAYNVTLLSAIAN